MISIPTTLKEEQSWKQFAKEAPVVLGSILLLTFVITFFHLSTRVPDSLLLYLLVVLIAACMCGLRTALLASLVAFALFDYIFVPPVYAFGATKLEDIIGLLVFLATTVLTSHIASSLRARSLQSHQYAYEVRTLYELVCAINRERNQEEQFSLFAKAIVEVFAKRGVRDCMVLLPDASQTFHGGSSPFQLLQTIPLLSDEKTAIEWIMLHARSVDLYHVQLPSSEAPPASLPAKRRRDAVQASRNYMLRLVPLKTGTTVLGILRLLIEEKQDHERLMPVSLPSQDVLFSTFLEQAITIIEQGRLREASIHLEVLQQTEVLRSALFSSVSHDFRTPLATIKAIISDQLLAQAPLDPAMYQVSAHIIEREVDRLDRLVENVLDMSRIEAGTLHLEKVWYPLQELVGDAVSHLQPHLATRQVHLIVPDELPPVKLDAVQIEQVFLNLLENALRYTPEGSPIDILIQDQEHTVQVTIADRGPGIPLAEQEHIFTKFYRLPLHDHARNPAPGLGLGLAICKGIIQAHHGHIWVEAREEEGAMFCFTLPLEKIEEMNKDE